MVKYMAKFIPSLSTSGTTEKTRMQRHLLDTYWNLTEILLDCEKAFTDIKNKQLTCTHTLAYYNPYLELNVQTDSSKDCLAAVLLQCGKPIELCFTLGLFISTKMCSN